MNDTVNRDPLAGRLWRIIYWGGAALLLSLPALAMQVNDEVNWGSEDFLAGGILFGLLGLGFELVARSGGSWQRRVAIGGMLVFVFLFVWAEMAVGIVGSPIAGS